MPKAALWELKSSPAATTVLLHKLLLTRTQPAPGIAGLALSQISSHSWGQSCQGSSAGLAGTCRHPGDEPPSTGGEADGLSLLVLLPQEPGRSGSEGGHCQQRSETLSLPHDTPTSTGLASAAGTAPMCSCQQRFAPTAQNTAPSSAGTMGGG